MHDASADGNIFRCTECGHKHCTVCKVTFHTAETCTQYQERIKEEAEREERMKLAKKDEEASLAKVKSLSVKCPGCGANIQKIDGCDHMTCKTAHVLTKGRADKTCRPTTIMSLRVLLRVPGAVQWANGYLDRRQLRPCGHLQL